MAARDLALKLLEAASCGVMSELYQLNSDELNTVVRSGERNLCLGCDHHQIQVSNLPCGCNSWCLECSHWFMNTNFRSCIVCRGTVTDLYYEGVRINIANHLEDLNWVRGGFCLYCKANKAEVSSSCACSTMCIPCSSLFLRTGPQHLCRVCYKPVSALILVGRDRVLDLRSCQMEFIGEKKYSKGVKEGSIKTVLCNNWISGSCGFNNCIFAHGIMDLRPVLRHRRYKTQLCRSVMMGVICSYDKKCQYRHQATAEEIEEITLLGRLFMNRIRMH